MKGVLLLVLHFCIRLGIHIKQVVYVILIYLLGFWEMIFQRLWRIPSLDFAQHKDYSNRVAICTGGTHGIGLSVTKLLCRQNIIVVAAGPNAIQEEDMTEELHDFITQGKLLYIPLDLSSNASIKAFIRNFTNKFSVLDYLINNAGVMLIPYRSSERGVEGHFAINFLGHYFLTDQLEYYLNQSSVVVNVSSSVSCLTTPAQIGLEAIKVDRDFYVPHFSYCLSKLAMCIHTAIINQEFRCKAVAVHPGIVATSLYDNVWWPNRLLQKHIFAPLFLRKADAAAQIIVNCTLNNECKSGRYYYNNKSSMLNFSPQTLERCKTLFDELLN